MFTSRENHALAAADGSLALLEESGAVVLKDTCPEVTPYNRERFNHLLTNSMKAEHYLTSGLNRIPTSVADIETCVAHAFNQNWCRASPRPWRSLASRPTEQRQPPRRRLCTGR